MAESLVGVTEGAGKSIHSFQRVIGANTVEDAVGVIGEQYLASYIVSPNTSGARSLATANSHVIQIMAGSALKVRIRRIELYQSAMATTAAMCTFALVRLTTAGTGGGVETVSPMDPADAAAGASCMTLPTVKGTVGTNLGLTSCYIMQTVGASTPVNEPFMVWNFEGPRTKPLIIAAGTANGIAVQNNTAVAAATVTFQVFLDESNF